MSYCVNCGVELTTGTKKCALCDTPVINPNELKGTDYSPAFPERIELPKETKNKYGAIIFSILLLIPNIVCVITNLLLTPELLWSIYVVSSSLMFWFLFIFPFIIKKTHPYIILTVDAIATAVYIYIFYYYESANSGEWFLKMALPLVAGIFFMIAMLNLYFSKKRTKIRSAIGVLTFLILVDIFVCVVINLYKYSVIATYITLIIGVSCLILLIFLIATDRNKKLYDWLTRKFFF